jgi:nickel-dependent lactate racemase
MTLFAGAFGYISPCILTSAGGARWLTAVTIMKVDLHYDRGLVSLQIPAANVRELIRPWQDDERPDNTTVLRQAMAGDEADSFQDEAAGKRVCVLIEDGTRDVPFEDTLGQLSRVLQGSSCVKVLICTGTHDSKTAENHKITEQVEKAAKAAGIERFSVHAHDCQDDTFLSAGQTSHGTEVLFNAEACDAELFLVQSDVKVHYFAGYSNPVKNFVPGICAYRTAEQNHSLALAEESTFGVHPWHSDRSKQNNPLATDQLEGMRLIVRDRLVYSLVTISTLKQIHWARFGPVEHVSREAFTTTDQRNTHTVVRTERLIVSPGGFPNDVSLYIAQRALELTKNGVQDGGEILFLAACPEGLGEDKTIVNFYDRLTEPIDKVLRSIESEYKLYSHKPYKFSQLIQRLRRISVYSDIPDSLIKAAHLCPVHDPQAVVSRWVAERPDVNITVVDGANKVALYQKT